MNIPTTIQVLTVISSDAIITYQQVYVNNEYAAKYDFEKQTEKHKDYILKGWTVSLRKF